MATARKLVQPYTHGPKRAPRTRVVSIQTGREVEPAKAKKILAKARSKAN